MMIVISLFFSVYAPDWGYSSVHDVNEGHRTSFGIGP